MNTDTNTIGLLKDIAKVAEQADEALGAERIVSDAREQILELFDGDQSKRLSRSEICAAVAMHNEWTFKALARLDYWNTLVIVDMQPSGDPVPAMPVNLEPVYQLASHYQTAFGWTEINS